MIVNISCCCCFDCCSSDLFKQPGRIAVITGGNRGIGADVVEKLLQCEINVIMGKHSQMLNSEFECLCK